MMYKTSAKFLLLFIFFTIFAVPQIFAQTLTIHDFPTGIYTPGSSIAAPFTINVSTNCIQRDNKFNLYLADALGNIIAPGTPIGTTTGFYGTFVNGVIPGGTAPGTYTLVVKSTNPVITSAKSTAFTVAAGTSVTAGITGSSVLATSPTVFGTCNGVAGNQFFFSDGSSTSASVATFFNESSQSIEGAPIAMASSSNPPSSFTAQTTNYTIIVTATNLGTIGTQAYTLLNNVLNNSFSVSNSSTICLPSSGGATLSYNVDISSPNGIQKNYPGTTYEVSWGDGSTSSYTICDIQNLGGEIMHTYTTGSCGVTSNSHTNSFEVDIQPQSPYCVGGVSPITTYAKVLQAPVNSIAPVPTGCKNTVITFTNTSNPGQDPSNSSISCAPNPAARYNWSVDGVVWLSGVPIGTNFTHTFTTNGNHTVTLSLQAGSTGVCTAPPVDNIICIQNPPQPVFTLPTPACLSAPVSPTENSVLDLTCTPAGAYTYLWAVTGPAAVTYAGSTSASSQVPQFVFHQYGTYQVTLSISGSSCGTVTSAPQTINVDAPPVATMSPDFAICGTNQTFNFNAAAGNSTQTIMTGTAQPLANTFTWTVTGGTFAFTGGTDAHSQAPQINFTGFGVYTISVTEQNSCGTSPPVSQHITFQNAPTVTITPSATSICPGTTVTLTGNVNPAVYNTSQWIGGGGAFTSVNTLSTTYTPTAAEIVAGRATITLDIKTSLTGACSDIQTSVTINIYPVDNITSVNAKQICTGSPVGYAITSSVPGSTFTWTAALTQGSATGFSNGGGPGITNINDVLTNTGSNNAVVTYTITPVDPNGCTGPAFTLNVTVNQVYSVTPTPVSSTICNNTSANINLAPNLAGTTYTWTSTVLTGSVTGNTQQTTPTATNKINDVLVNSGTTAATVQYTLTPINGSCQGSTASTTITVQPSPATSNPGSNDEVCNQTSYHLHGNTPPAGAGLWTVTPTTGVTFDDATNPTATASGLSPGTTYSFTWTITIPGGCQSSSNSVIIKDDAPSVGGTTSGGTTVCSGSNNGTITLAGNVGNVLRWESSTNNFATSTTITNTGTSLPYLNLTQTTQYRAVVTNGVCTFANSSVTTITVNQPPTIANAGANDQICNQTSYLLHGNAPLVGTGLWTANPAAGITFDDATNPNATASGLSPGTTYQFTWTITPGAPCSPNASTVIIRDDLPSVGGTTSGGTTVCSGSNSGTITLAGKVGNVLRWESSTDNFATSTTINSTSTSQAYVNLTQTTYYRAVVMNGVCTSANSSVTIITVNPPPTAANAGLNDEVCNTPSYTLHGNAPTSGNGLWTLASGQSGVTFDNAANPNATASGLVAVNTYQFTWTISTASPCSPSTSTVTIKDDLPSVGGTTAGTNTFCAGNNNGNVTLSGQTGTVAHWELSTDGGANWAVIANTGTIQQYSNLTQTTQYRAMVKNGPCSFDYSSATIIFIYPPPTPSNAGLNDEVCSTPTYALHGNAPTSGNGLWTLASGQTGVTFDNAANPNATASGLVAGNTYQFTWTISTGAPCSPSASTVTIKDDLPTVGGATAGANTFCAGDNTGNVILSGQTGRVVRWEFSTDGGNTWQNIANTNTSQSYLNLTQTTWYRALVQNGVCTSAYSSPTIITINQPATTANAGQNTEVCATTTYVLQGNAPTSGTGLWTLASGQTGVTFDNAANPNATASGLVAGNTYRFTWTISTAAPCPPSAGTVTIVDDLTTIGGNTAGANTVCSGDNGGTITLSGQLGRILRWESSTDNGATWQNIGTTTASVSYLNLTQTTHYRAVIQNGVCNVVPSTETIIQVNQPAPVANAGPNQNLCNASATTLNGNNPGAFPGLWTQTGGPTATITDPANYQSTVTGLSGGNVYAFTWTISALAPCPTTQSQVTIINNNDVIASFTTIPKSGCGNLAVQFTNTSNNQAGATFVWNFGDGSASSGTVSPRHTFAQRTDGRDTTYYISLSVIGNCAQRAPVIDSVLVRPATPIARILPNSVSGCGNFPLDVQNISPGNNTTYDFYLYDGSVLVQKITKTDKSDALFNPITTTSRKTFTLYMIATGYCNNTAESIHIPITISPFTIVGQMFVQNNINKGCVPLNVTFINNSSGGDNFHYNIYNSDNRIVDQPIGGTEPLPYTFRNPGTYYVTITASNSCGSSESAPRIRIDVYAVPTPNFTADITQACKDGLVTFTNTTISNDINTPVTSLIYDWDFGDSTTHSSAYAPPPHNYHFTNSPYTVTLTATNSATGCGTTLVKQAYIVINGPPATAFAEKTDSVISIPNYTFSFIDQTKGSPVSWKWTFSDGQTSTKQNPIITFPDTGLYKATLTTTNALGCDSTITHTVRIIGVPGQLYMPNAFIPTSLTNDLKIFIAKGSGIKTWLMQIFDKYGQLVWQTNKLDSKGAPVEGWDGTFKGMPAPQGVYVWQVSATFINGTEWKGMSYNGSLPKRLGSIHLIR